MKRESSSSLRSLLARHLRRRPGGRLSGFSSRPDGRVSPRRRAGSLAMSALLAVGAQFPIAATLAPSALASGAPAEVWVDDGYTSGGSNDGHTWGTDAFATIDAGILAVAAGGTVNVGPGTYNEYNTGVPDGHAFSYLYIGKPLALRGAGFGLAPGASGRTGGESTIAWNGATTSDAAVTVAADNVTIDGFEIANFYEGIVAPIPSGTRTGITIAHNWIHSNRNWSLVTMNQNTAGNLTDVTLEHNLLTVSGNYTGKTGTRALSFSGSGVQTDIVVRDNTVDVNGGAVTGNRFLFGPSVSLVDGLTMTGNTIVSGGYNMVNVKNATISGNIFGSGSGAATRSGVYISVDNSACTDPGCGIIGNTFSDESYLGFWGSVGMTKNLVIRNNRFGLPRADTPELFFDDAPGGLDLGSVTVSTNSFAAPWGSKDCVAYANVVVSGPGSGTLSALGNWWGSAGGLGDHACDLGGVNTDTTITGFTANDAAVGFFPTEPLYATTFPSGSTELSVPVSELGAPSIGFSSPSEAPVILALTAIESPLDAAGTPFKTSGSPLILDIELTGADGTGPYTLCFAGSDGDLIWMYDAQDGWTVLADSSFNVATGKVCGTTSHFSTWALGATKIATVSTLASSDTTTTYGDAVTFTLSVEELAGSGVPTGTMGLYEGATLIDDCTLSGGTCDVVTSTIGAGSHILVARYAGSDDHAASESNQVTQGVAQASLSVTADSTSVTYGGSEPAYTISYDGFVNGETKSVLDTEPTCESAYTVTTSVAASPLTIACSGGADDNYSFSYTDGELEIAQATLTVTPADDTVYVGDPEPAYDFDYDGFRNGDDTDDLDTQAACDSAYTQGDGVGSETITCTAGTDTDYAFDVTATATLTIAKATVWIVPDDASPTYGDAAPGYTFRVYYDAGLTDEEADPATNLAGWVAPSCTSGYTAASHVADGPFTIACSGGSADDYELDLDAEGTLTIGQAELTVTVADDSTTYGEAAPAFAPSFEGFLNGDDADDLGTEPACAAAGYSVGSNAGDYPVTCTGGSDGDYTFDLADTATLTVDPRTLTVTAANKSVTYGNPAPAYTATGDFYGSDTFLTAPSCTSDYAQGDGVGTDTISCSGGTASANYETPFTYQTGTLTINARALTVTANDATTGYTEAAPAYGASANFYGSDDFTTEPICTSTYAQGNNAGAYPITCSGGDAGANYATPYTYRAGTLTVTPFELEPTDPWYTGQTFYYTKSATDTAVQVTLTASISADFPADCSGGSVANGTVTFRDQLSGKTLASGVRIALVGGDCGTGIATAIATLSAGNYFVNNYLIVVETHGSLTGSNEATGGQIDTEPETATVVVSVPAAKASGIFGAGELAYKAGTSASELGTEGTLTGEMSDGSKADVALGFTYGKKGVTPKGQALIVLPGPGGTTYLVKTNSITSVATNLSALTATIYAKASVQQNGCLVGCLADGGASVRIDLTKSGALAGITVTSSKTSALYYANDWYKTKAWQTRQGSLSGFGAYVAIS